MRTSSQSEKPQPRRLAKTLVALAYDRVAHRGMREPAPYVNPDMRVIPREEHERVAELYRRPT